MRPRRLLGTYSNPENLVEMLRQRAEYLPQKRVFTFLVDGESEEQHLTFQELDRRARAIAGLLQERNLAGERALLLYPPGLDFVTGFFGCLYAGVVAVTAYPPRMNRSLGRIEAIVADAGARIALTTTSVLERVSPWLNETPDLARIQWLTTEQTPEGIEDRWSEPDVDGSTLAFLQYTSGSTGTPKGVMLSHSNLLHNSSLISFGFEHTRNASGVFWLPSYHDMGLVGGIIQPAYIGGSNVLMSPMAFLQKPVRWLRAISKFGASTSGGPNFAYDLCLRKVRPEERETLDLSSWKVAFNGAEPVRDETLEHFAEYFAPCGFDPAAFYPCYGLAEATLIVSGGTARHSARIRSFESRRLEQGEVVHVDANAAHSRRLVGCGSNLPDQQIAIVDPETRRRCPSGSIGEIWVTGPSVAQGYWKRPEETTQTFQARLSDTGQGPFLRTGDLGFLDEGELYVTGRIKDLIIVRGVNHYPQDIELTVEHCDRALRPNSGAAFSFELNGRSNLAVVQEVERGHQADADRLVEAIRLAVTREHDLQLDAIVLVRPGSIPKTSSGKIQRHACRHAYLKNQLKMVVAWKSDAIAPAAPQSVMVHSASANGAASSATNSIGHAAHRNGSNGEHRVGSPTNGAYAHSANGGVRTTGRNGKAARADRMSVIAGTDEHHGSLAGRNGFASNGASTNGDTSSHHISQVVMDMIRSVCAERSVQLSLDTSLAQIGLDSLQRIELQAMIEEHYGRRLPEDLGPQLETIRQIVGAVEDYLCGSSEESGPKVALADIPEDYYRLELHPEYLKLRQTMALMESSGAVNPYFRIHEQLTNDTTIIDGHQLINFSTYNYLGMSGDPAVLAAAKDAIDRYGTSSSASRLVSGDKRIHRELEDTVADFLGAPACIAFVSGHATNVTTIGHLFGQGDLILHDALAHNSIVQGSLLSGAKRRPFPHNDWRALDRLLADLRTRYRRVLVAIEGTYSMDGDIPDLPRFIEVKERHKCLLMVDEAHSAGVLGRRGRGVGEYFGVQHEDVDIWMGTLSKAWGSCGGYICGSPQLVEYLKYTAPGFVFSAGLSPPDAAAAMTAIRVIEAEPERVKRLHQRARLFLELAQSRGLNTGLSRGTPIVPIVLGNSLHCLQLSRALYERGVNVQPILYPAVEESSSRLRFFITAMHTEEQIRYAVDVLAEEAERIDPRYVSRKPIVENTVAFAAGLGALHVAD